MNFKSHIINEVSKLINVIIPTRKNRIYVRYIENSPLDKYDIENCNSSNMFCFLNYFINIYHTNIIDLYIETYDINRSKSLTLINETAQKNNVYIHYIKGPEYHKKGINYFLEIKNSIFRFSSSIWMNESGGTKFYGKLKKQKIICLNYFISCKNDYYENSNINWNLCDYILTTALLPAQILCCSERIDLYKCHIVGFPRNDTLLYSNKKENIYKWLEKELNFIPKHIFVYVPTYRDYERFQDGSRNILGFKTNDLNEYLLEKKAIIIYKTHPYHTKKIKGRYSNIIEYKTSYDYSLYDVLSVSSCLISDYSSVIFDYLLINKPIIYNLYDYEMYKKERGLSYDPYIEICAGDIVYNEKDLMRSIKCVMNKQDNYKTKRNELIKFMHKNKYSLCTKKVYDDIMKYIGNNFI